MARQVTAVVETGKDSYWCFIAGDHDWLPCGFSGAGKTVREAIESFYAGRDEAKADCEECGEEFPDMEFRFVFDVGAFFNYYPLSITAFAKYIGMNASLLRQYATGIKTPKGKSLEKIRLGIEKIRMDIDPGSLIDRPVTQYV